MKCTLGGLLAYMSPCPENVNPINIGVMSQNQGGIRRCKMGIERKVNVPFNIRGWKISGYDSLVD